MATAVGSVGMEMTRSATSAVKQRVEWVQVSMGEVEGGLARAAVLTKRVHWVEEAEAVRKVGRDGLRSAESDVGRSRSGAEYGGGGGGGRHCKG